MLKLFYEKVQNQEYVSNYLYESVKEDISKTFDLETYNHQVLNRLYEKHKLYFATMFQDIDPAIHLDEDQIKAILAEEDYSLIIAGAGSGKTTTIVAKVKYLVDKKKVNPSSILVMSYTKKATEELAKRIVYDFGIPAKVTTIHSLGYSYIREVFYPRKCYVVDENQKYKIFYEYFTKEVFPYKTKVKQIIETFDELFSGYFKEHYQEYQTYQEYLEAYKNKTIQETTNIHDVVERIIKQYLYQDTPKTIRNELVKSIGEAKIANFLFCNGLSYHYEKIYQELVDDNKVYHPDFTVHVGGEDIYIEYFGLSNYKANKLSYYNKLRAIKEAYHKERHTKFIALDYEPNEDYLGKLKRELINLGVQLKPLTEEEIYYQILSNNPTRHIFKYQEFLYSNIETIKNSNVRKNYYNIVQEYLSKTDDQKSKVQFAFIQEFFQYYQSVLYGGDTYGFDFEDLIYYATLYLDSIKNENLLGFKHIIIDEYQDISMSRYEFMKKIATRTNAFLTAMGDDWQTIFSFAGSKIDYIYNFQNYFKGAKIFTIAKTYRNCQELVDYSGNFIMKNPNQIKKNLFSDKHLDSPIKFVEFSEGEEYETLKKLILWIHKQNKNHSILILGRTNQMIERCFKEKELKDSIGTKIEFLGYKDLNMDGMTIHKAKGLTYDEVILIGLSEKWPREEKSLFWLKSLLKGKTIHEPILYPEERRLFYVALTRTKNYVYLLTNQEKEKRSPFVAELAKIIEEKTLQ